jgi:hypothetical protein
MKQWELRGVTVDRWGFPMSTSSTTSSVKRKGEEPSGETRGAQAERTPRTAPSDEDARHSER